MAAFRTRMSRSAITSALPENPVLLGSVGFLDQFTITASRYAQAVAVENRDTLDERFGTVLSG